MMLWWIGNVILLLVIVPVLVALLNRVLAALERIRGASDDILAGGVGADRRTRCVPELLATPTRPSTTCRSALCATPAPSPSSRPSRATVGRHRLTCPQLAIGHLGLCGHTLIVAAAGPRPGHA